MLEKFMREVEADAHLMIILKPKLERLATAAEVVDRLMRRRSLQYVESSSQLRELQNSMECLRVWFVDTCGRPVTVSRSD